MKNGHLIPSICWPCIVDLLLAIDVIFPDVNSIWWICQLYTIARGGIKRDPTLRFDGHGTTAGVAAG